MSSQKTKDHLVKASAKLASGERGFMGSNTRFIEVIPSPIGDVTLGSDGKHLTGLWLDTQKYFMANVVDAANLEEKNDLPIFQETRKWLEVYFQGKDPGVIPAVKPQGSEFREKIWHYLTEIPYGKLATYGELAQRIAAERGMAKMSSRAVGGAVGHNPISIIIPCHRVVGSNGNLTGYGGGIERKIQLLKLEGIDY